MSGSTSTTDASIALITGQAPGVFQQELDTSGTIAGISTAIGAMVGGMRRGPLGPIVNTSYDEWQSNFGINDATWSFCGHSAQIFLRQSNILWFNRVVHADAQFGGLSVINDVAGSSGVATRITPRTIGTTNDYSTAYTPITNIIFTGNFVTGNVITLALAYNNMNIPSVTINFVTDHNTTMADIALALNTAINTQVGTVGINYATLVPSLTNPLVNTGVKVVSPEGEYFAIRASITGGASEPTITNGLSELFSIFEIGPSSDSDIGILISNVDVGVPQRLILSFSAALVTGNTFSGSFLLNGNVVTVAPTGYAANNDATLAAISAAIQNALGAYSSTYVVPSGATGFSSARQIVVVSPLDGPNTLSLQSAIITGGSESPITTVTASTAVTGITSTDTFTLSVYTLDNLNSPAEQFVVSLKTQLDGFNIQQNIEEVVNNSDKKSKYIRVKQNQANLSGDIISNFLPTTPTFISGGTVGSLPTSSDIINGWQAFADVENIDVRLLINSGYTDPSIQQTMVSIAASRRDAFACLDMPSDQQDAQSAVNYRNNSLNINSSYGSIYSPDIQILDTETNRLIYVPPSAYAAARFAWVDNNYANWYANAGVIYGILDDARDLRYKYTKGDRILLENAQICAVRKFRDGSGICIFSVQTLQSYSSLLSFNHIRRMLSYCQTSIARQLESVDFQLITEQTQFNVVQSIKSFLQPIQDAQGLAGFLVVCDGRNNKPVHKDAGQLNISVYFTPNPSAKTVLLRSIITPATIDFNTQIINGII